MKLEPKEWEGDGVTYGGQGLDQAGVCKTAFELLCPILLLTISLGGVEVGGNSSDTHRAAFEMDPSAPKLFLTSSNSFRVAPFT